jgi:hypothetical protein
MNAETTLTVVQGATGERWWHPLSKIINATPISHVDIAAELERLAGQGRMAKSHCCITVVDELTPPNTGVRRSIWPVRVPLDKGSTVNVIVPKPPPIPEPPR